MKLIKPSFSIIEQQAGLEGIYKQIEAAGRTCYKSEDKITEDSAKPFVDRMIKSGHGAMLEHGTVYLQVPNSNDICLVLELNPYTKCKLIGDTCYVTTNLRVLVEHDALWLMKHQCEPTEFHEKRATVHFVCDRGVSHEFVRHRVFSFAQESTRYCRYSADRFNGELTFIKPCWTNIPEGDYGDVFNPKEPDITLTPNEYAFIDILRESEKYYIGLTNNGWKAEQARAVLPNSLKTELVVTGFISDWQHFFELRCDKAAHPQARELAIPLKEEFIKRGYITE